MADFTALDLEANIGTNGSPSWSDVLGANREVRWSHLDTQSNVASASWPYMTRPGSATGVDYCYAFTADATGEGLLSGAGSTPAAFSINDYRQFRWNWDNTGTMASAPIFTAYPTTGHGSVSRGDGSLLGGHTTDTNDAGTARSYLKGNAFGQQDSVAVPAAAPTAVAATDGTTGTVSPTSGANWLSTEWQSLMGDSDYITAPFTPAATTANQWSVMLRLFTGAAMALGTHVPVISIRYTYT